MSPGFGEPQLALCDAVEGVKRAFAQMQIVTVDPSSPSPSSRRRTSCADHSLSNRVVGLSLSLGIGHFRTLRIRRDLPLMPLARRPLLYSI
jgi:hypothetical protein